MTAEQIEEILRLWGRVFGEARPKEFDEDSSGSLAGSTSNLLGRLHIGDGEHARRKRRWRVFLDAKGRPQYESAPEFRVSGKETRTAGSSWNPPPELLEVELAAMDLYHFNPLRGVVLRIEYCLRGRRQKEKAILVGQCEGIEDRISLRRYRHELGFAREFMAGKLHAKKLDRNA